MHWERRSSGSQDVEDFVSTVDFFVWYETINKKFFQKSYKTEISNLNFNLKMGSYHHLVVMSCVKLTYTIQQTKVVKSLGGKESK